MLKQKKIEAAIEELSRLQGHELNAADMLELRCWVACTLAAKERPPADDRPYFPVEKAHFVAQMNRNDDYCR